MRKSFHINILFGLIGQIYIKDELSMGGKLAIRDGVIHLPDMDKLSRYMYYVAKYIFH